MPEYLQEKETIENWLTQHNASFHHTAIVSGYIRKDGHYIDDYEGKFGKGYVLHLPTSEMYFKSKRYHPVEYWLIDTAE